MDWSIGSPVTSSMSPSIPDTISTTANESRPTSSPLPDAQDLFRRTENPQDASLEHSVDSGPVGPGHLISHGGSTHGLFEASDLMGGAGVRVATGGLSDGRDLVASGSSSRVHR